MECFAIVSDLASRRLSHNDRWILASAIAHGLLLVTEDEQLHAAANHATLAERVRAQLGSTPQGALLV